MGKVKLTLIQGDCLDSLPTLENESVDLILTDPPQNISRKDEITRLGGRGRAISYDFGDWDFFKTKEEYLSFMKKWIDDCIQLLKPNCNFVIFIAREYLSYIGNYLVSKNFKWRQTLHWIKTNPVPHLRKVTFANGVEQAIFCSRGKHIFNYKLGHSPNYIIAPIVMGKKRIKINGKTHPTQKPEKVIDWIIKYLSNEGDIILDPFLGSGTTMFVCRDLKRSCIGIDISPEYIKMTKKRLNWNSSLNPNIKWEFKIIGNSEMDR